VRGQIICVRFVSSQLGSVLGDIKSNYLGNQN